MFRNRVVPVAFLVIFLLAMGTPVLAQMDTPIPPGRSHDGNGDERTRRGLMDTPLPPGFSGSGRIHRSLMDTPIPPGARRNRNNNDGDERTPRGLMDTPIPPGNSGNVNRTLHLSVFELLARVRAFLRF